MIGSQNKLKFDSHTSGSEALLNLDLGILFFLFIYEESLLKSSLAMPMLSKNIIIISMWWLFMI